MFVSTIVIVYYIIFRWISENAEFKKTLDSAVERGYIYGRKWIAAKVSMLSVSMISALCFNY